MLSNKFKYISFAVLLLPVMVFIQRTFFLPDDAPVSLKQPHLFFVVNIYIIILYYRDAIYGLGKRLNMKIVGSWAGVLVSVYLTWFIFFSTSFFATEVTLAIFWYLWAVFPLAVYPYFGKSYLDKDKKA